MGLSGSQRAYMQARADLARADGTRAGYFFPNALVLINGTDRATSVRLDTIQIEDAIADQPNRLTFTMRGPVSERPSVGQPVIVALGANQPELRLFAGTIMAVTMQMPRSVGAYTSWLVDAADYHWLLDRRVVTATYTNTSATLAAEDIIARFTTGFSGRYIARALPAVTVPFTNAKPTEALGRLAEMVGGTVYWDDAQTIYLYTSTTVPSVQQPAALTDTNTRFWDLQVHYDLSQTRTRVIVEGRRTPCLVSTPAGTSTITIGASASVDYLIVGGGGGGASYSLGGGGGAGGVLTGSETIGSGTYAVTVGGGGAADTNGSDSSWNAHTATGGGKGGNTTTAGGNGGSGGGGAFGQSAGTGTSGQGHNGGAGFSFAAGAGGGGGGWGAAGSAGSANVQGTVGGNGGAGASSSISGTVQYYGGGGGGNGSVAAGNGGIGGGGRGGAGGNPGTAGTANTGGGGGGGGGYAGGSGIVVIRYLTGDLSATGGTITTSGGYTIHTFTSGGNFVVSDIVLTSAPAVVTDLPITDASQLDPAGGTVRIGPHVVTYLSLIGPDKDPGENAPTSVVTAEAAVSATSITVADITVFTGAYGWVRVGDQIIRYGSKSGSNLQEIPALGLGAITGLIKVDTQVSYLDGIRLSNTGIEFDPPVVQNEPVIQRVTVNDTAAQATLAALEGGDGIHEHVIQADDMTVQGCLDRANSELDAFALPITSVSYATRDLNTRSGRLLNVDLSGFPAVAGNFTIQNVTISFADIAGRTVSGPGAFPVRRVTASPVRVRNLIDAIGLTEDSLP